jgi:hypothetical protein
MLHVVDSVVTSAGRARKFIGFDLRHSLRISVMDCALLETTCAFVTVQALTIVIGLVKVDRLRWLAKILDVDVSQSPELGLDVSIHTVVGVAGITSTVVRDAMTLIVARGHIIRIINM